MKVGTGCMRKLRNEGFHTLLSPGSSVKEINAKRIERCRSCSVKAS